MTLQPHTVTAHVLPEHVVNAIHTDEGARAAGYAAALVPGVTAYVHLCHVPVAAWGRAWVERGGAEVRFLSPILDGDLLELDPTERDGACSVHATVDGDVRATCSVWLAEPPSVVSLDGNEATPEPSTDEHLPVRVEPLVEPWADYGQRAGDELDLWAADGIVHPAVWLDLANQVTADHLVDGPWIHVRSRVTHFAAAAVGATAVVSSTVISRFETRSGERAVLDVRITVDDELVAVVEHESIVRLARS